MTQVSNPFLRFIEMNRDELLDKWTEKMKELDNERVSSVISDQVYYNICNDFIVILHQKFRRPEDDLISKINEFSIKIVQLGWSLKLILAGLSELNKIIFEMMTVDKTEEEKMSLVWEFDKLISPITSEVLHQYASSWERTVSLQKIALQELSAPLIPVFDNITVMPLVGTIDTERAKSIMENLLQGVVKHRAEVVLIDITGVPVVDTMVAHHIIQASEAVRLVGAKCLLVGIRPEIAQTIVNLGIDLSQLTTKNSLQKGIEYALEMTDRQIVRLEE
ncbi:STAS domain-containing protein [Metabacillus sediminilitoris]|uniref:STAS domain-containing protein n=1 Tax=Metabacillus sediminilitoris TaxID=2567941 RepID=A0A4S4BKY1_9BACI|nr:STAS domain-containing protein [Metabacillus sediminilitoris]QGQ44076.1 STAS domain-containing protein [Metabacillus sediminilitoris]THF75410.1 STAS domain-containing protein [Metabacillus sediminilitoris]